MKDLQCMKRCNRNHQVRTATDPVLGFGGRKATSSMFKISTLGVLRLRATPSAVSRDRSVRRSAQDDDFVRVLTNNTQSRTGLMLPVVVIYLVVVEPV
jgi:hypothetical protein